VYSAGKLFLTGATWGKKMKNEIAVLDELMLVGITARTNNANEMDSGLCKIPGVVSSYWEHNMADQIHHAIRSGITYAVYTEFDGDENGDYTFFYGEEVASFEGQNESAFRTLSMASGRYQKFTSDRGPLPDIVISSWQKIWKMKAGDFAGDRTYLADFEVYDKRAADPSNAIIDIYIGIR